MTSPRTFHGYPPSVRPSVRPAGRPAGRPAYYYYDYYYCYYYYYYYYYTFSDPAHNLSDPAKTRQIVRCYCCYYFSSIFQVLRLIGRKSL